MAETLKGMFSQHHEGAAIPAGLCCESETSLPTVGLLG